MFNKSILPLVFLFLIIAAVIMIFKNHLTLYGFDWQVLSGGNLFIYIITTLSMHMLRAGMNASNTHSFLTRAYGGILIKLFACAIAAFIYIFIARHHLNKPGLFACMALYFVYTFVEMKVILKYSNQKKNAVT